MPFEPQLNPDDESTQHDLELALSPRLSALADRLSADADSIAARYPIEASPAFGHEFWKQANQALEGEVSKRPQPEECAGRSRRWIATISGAATACVLLAAIMIWRLSDRGESAGENFRASGIAQGDSRAQQGSADLENLMRVNILEGLSGAEQEAVLDLLDRQMPTEPSLSI